MGHKKSPGKNLPIDHELFNSIPFSDPELSKRSNYSAGPRAAKENCPKKKNYFDNPIHWKTIDRQINIGKKDTP